MTKEELEELSNEDYFEWLNKQDISRKEYYNLFFVRLKRNKEAIKAMGMEEIEN